MSEGLAGTAFVDLEPRFGAGFGAGIASKLKAFLPAALAIGTVGALTDLGSHFEDAFFKIRQETGATGKDLLGLKSAAREAFTDVPVSITQSADAVSALYQRTHLLGPQLRTLADQQLYLAKITGTDVATNILATTSLWAKYGIAVKDQGPNLDVLFKASQQSGLGVDTLTGLLTKGGAALQAYGFNFSQSAALAANLSRILGSGATRAFTALTSGFGKIAKAGLDPKLVLEKLISDLRGGVPHVKAMAEAMGIFGARGGLELATAIQKGGFSVASMLKTITNGKGGIIATGEATLSLGDKFKLLRNRVENALEPLAIGLVDLAQKGLDKLLGAFSRGGKIVGAAWDDIVGGFKNPDAKIGSGVGIFDRIFLRVGSLAKKTSADVSKDWSGLFTGLRGGDTSGITGIAGGFARAGSLIRGTVKTVIADVRPLGGIITRAFDAVRNIDFGKLFGTIGAALGTAISAVKGFDFAPILERVRSVVTRIVADIRGIDFKSIFGHAEAIVAPILPPLRELGVAVLKLAVAAFPVLRHTIADLVGGAIALKPVLGAVVVVAYLLARAAGEVLAVGLHVVAAAIGLLARHASILRPILIAVVGAFVAFKAVQAVQAGILGAARAAGTAVGTFQRLGTSAVSLFRSGSDGLRLRLMYAKDGATKLFEGLKGGLSTVASFAKSMLTSAASVAKQTVAFIAQKGAALASAVASKAMAAAQWLVNAAMDANPITLVVAAIAALAAGVVLAYIKFKPFRDIVDDIGHVLKRLATVVLGGVETAIGWVRSHWPILLAILTGPFGLAALAIAKNWSKITAGASAALHAIIGFFTKLPGEILGALAKAGSWLDGIGKDIVDGLIDGLKLELKLVDTIWVKLPERILGYLIKAGTWLLDSGSKIIGGLVHGIGTGELAIWHFLTGLPGRIGGYFAKAATWLVDAGAHIMEGLIKGIESKIGGLLKTMGGVAHHVEHAVTHPWEVFSPSKLFYRIGGFLIAGLIQGLGELDPLDTALGVLTKHVIDPLTKADIAGTVGKLNAQPRRVDPERFAAIYRPRPPVPTDRPVAAHAAHAALVEAHPGGAIAGDTYHQENHFHGHDKPTGPELEHAGARLQWLIRRTGRKP